MMAIIQGIFYIAGSLGLLVYGMRLLSEGVQRAAGNRLQSTLNHLTTNRFAALCTGFFVTVLVQSSSATTVMIVSFVNATLLTLPQAIGAIMGANIGTTVTGWIIAILGFSFDISSAALPAIGIGSFLIFSKRYRRPDVGEALTGFGLLFLGLSFLKEGVPDVAAYPEILRAIASLAGHGLLSVLFFVIVGAALTVIVQSSSAAVTITLTMAYAGWIDFPTAAAIILGENIGTTITANLAAMGGTITGRRAARAHLVFNAAGVLWMLAVFPWALELILWIAPGALLPTRLALFHTGFNVANTLLFIGFVRFLAYLATRLVPDRDTLGLDGVYRIPIPTEYAEGHAELYMGEVRHEVVRMARIVETMISDSWRAFEDPSSLTGDKLDDLKRREDYTDQMQEQISRVLATFSSHGATDRVTGTALALMRVVGELESIADSSFNIALTADRCRRKQIGITPEAIAELRPYAELVRDFAGFVDIHIRESFREVDLLQAQSLERKINTQRNQLKKSARRRIQQGSDVTAELLVIDIISYLEHMGDYALNIAEAVRQLARSNPLPSSPVEYVPPIKPYRTSSPG